MSGLANFLSCFVYDQHCINYLINTALQWLENDWMNDQSCTFSVYTKLNGARVFVCSVHKLYFKWLWCQSTLKLVNNSSEKTKEIHKNSRSLFYVIKIYLTLHRIKLWISRRILRLFLKFHRQLISSLDRSFFKVFTKTPELPAVVPRYFLSDKAFLLVF
jgi:hypothetical protein